MSNSQGFTSYTGPWAISRWCEANTHNTTYAAMGRGADKVKCICPHACVLYKEERERRRDAFRDKKQEKGKPKRRVPHLNPMSNGVHAPDLTEGACTSLLGRALADSLLSRPQSKSTINKLKTLCDTCPVLEQCRTWVLTGETYPGGWGGVIGGMSPVERKELAANDKP